MSKYCISVIISEQQNHEAVTHREDKHFSGDLRALNCSTTAGLLSKAPQTPAASCSHAVSCHPAQHLPSLRGKPLMGGILQGLPPPEVTLRVAHVHEQRQPQQGMLTMRSYVRSANLGVSLPLLVFLLSISPPLKPSFVNSRIPRHTLERVTSSKSLHLPKFFTCLLRLTQNLFPL
jgi:hypothetical protein